MHVSCTPTTPSIVRIKTKPANKQDIHLRRGAKLPSIGPLLHHKVVDSNDPGVPVRERRVTVFIFFMRQDHDVGVCTGVRRFLHPACIICRGPEADGLVDVHHIPMKNDAVAFLIRKVVFVPVIRLAFGACQ